MDAQLTAGVGTPLYMAPEVLAGEGYGPAADVFSFGVLLWEIAEQRSPDIFEELHPGEKVRGPILTAIMKLLANGERLEISATAAPPWYRRLSIACMHAKPSERPTMTRVVETFGMANDIQAES
eukprot:TRINITY_DN11034_c0_g1_i1.p4 TRINITY_DN11034_c0_g1~~TRINITY_DN11034_c0_g1_i1.p4  ORF type:complete len:124 (+),score=37.00 TRINITY_DN11034_c0_g1_i1:2326-2697(+)